MVIYVMQHGYIEEGATTTPFKMLTLNRCSRYHVAIDAVCQSCHMAIFNFLTDDQIRGVMAQHEEFSLKGPTVIAKYVQILEAHDRYIEQNGADPPHLQKTVQVISIAQRASASGGAQAAGVQA